MSLSLLLVFTIVSCQPRQKCYDIDSTIDDILTFNQNRITHQRKNGNDKAFFIFMSNELSKHQTGTPFNNIKQKVDSAKLLSPNQKCDCLLRDDTITIIGGNFYGKEVTYEMKMTREEFDARIRLESNRQTRYKRTEDGDFPNDVFLSSSLKEVKFYEEPKFQLGEIIKGSARLISEEYIASSHDSLFVDQMHMKLLFQCKFSIR